MQTGAPEHLRPWNLTTAATVRTPVTCFQLRQKIPPPANRPSFHRSAPGLTAPYSPPAFETPLTPVPYLGGLLSTIQGRRQTAL